MNWFAVGALFAGTGVALGAFGAHGLRSLLSPEMLAVYETGVRYQMFHGLALLALGWAAERWHGRLIALAGWLFVLGIVVFSGTLYLLTLTGMRWLGAVTPVGGCLLILAWLCLAVASVRGRPPSYGPS
jgi:uncharacterized membrane protein YgdD (TMEM256/DUF423 family)